jgi:hypothetical protein
MSPKHLLSALLLALFAVACGKSVGSDRASQSSREPSMPACDESLEWSFVQPQPTLNRSVDLLFVVDTSISLSPERDRLASSIPEFVSRISSEADLRIAILPAHGGASNASGRLHTPFLRSPVLKVNSENISDIQKRLRAMLRADLPDADEAGGEMPMYALLKTFESQNLNRIKGQGFYRDDAALAVVIVTDENDVCFDPQAHGYTAFPDFSPSPTWEKIAYNRYCSGITPERVVSEVKGLKKNGRLAFAGIAHTDPAQVLRGGEDAIGHGIIELVQSTVDGIMMDISQTSYSQGLSKLADAVESRLDLHLQFDLSGGRAFDPETVRVRVDQRGVVARFDRVRNAVELSPVDAGKAGSLIEVTACAVSKN